MQLPRLSNRSTEPLDKSGEIFQSAPNIKSPKGKNLLGLISKQENDKIKLQSEISLYKMVLSNSSEIINIMTAFFFMSFREIAETGFDLLSLETVRAVLSESHIVTLRD